MQKKKKKKKRYLQCNVLYGLHNRCMVGNAVCFYGLQDNEFLVCNIVSCMVYDTLSCAGGVQYDDFWNLHHDELQGV